MDLTVKLLLFEKPTLKVSLIFPMDGRMDGWMICYFMFFSTLFQSCQDAGPMIMKGCVQANPFRVEKSSPGAGLELRNDRSVGQHLTH